MIPKQWMNYDYNFWLTVLNFPPKAIWRSKLYACYADLFENHHVSMSI